MTTESGTIFFVITLDKESKVRYHVLGELVRVDSIPFLFLWCKRNNMCVLVVEKDSKRTTYCIGGPKGKILNRYKNLFDFTIVDSVLHFTLKRRVWVFLCP